MTAKGQRVHRGPIRTATVVAALLVTAGCTGKGNANPPTTSRTSAPVISQPAATPTPSTKISVPASMSPAEAKAVANAIEAYKQWVAAVDFMTQSGGTDLSRVKRLSAQIALINDQLQGALFEERGWHSTGERRIQRIFVESVKLSKNRAKNLVPEIILLVCTDASDTEALDKNGKSVITAGNRVYEGRAWIRNLPQSEYPQVGAGVDGWLIGQFQNHEVPRC